MNISTHTLTWSVTVADICTSQSLFHFNSHAHVERDVAVGDTAYPIPDFNSHAHVERDRKPLLDLVTFEHFNSHAHVERDCTIFAFRACFKNFNSHAHVERDRRCQRYGRRLWISTHTLTWSVTCTAGSPSDPRKFQLTRSRGA